MRPWCRAGGRPSVARLACVLLAAAAASACSSSGSSSVGPRFGFETPAVGGCRVLTTADISPASNETPTVSCSSPHTSVTVSVGGFPESEVTNANLTNGRLGDEALQRCTADWRRTVGGDAVAQHTTVVGLAYYLPNPTQLSAGARWYRCDVVIGGQDGMPLVDLPAQVKGLLDGTLPASLRACRTAPDFNDGHEVACTSSHVLRAVGIAPLPDQAAYPGESALKAASASGCQTVVRRWLAGAFGGGAAYQWPDQVSWRLLGDRSATCWAVTTR